MMARADLQTLEGVVLARNSKGVRLHGEDAWRNISLYAQPVPVFPVVGTRVRLTVDRSGFVRDCEALTAATAPDPKAEGEPDASAPPDRERQIARMAVLNTATAILASGARRVDIDDLLALAADLEHWVFR